MGKEKRRYTHYIDETRLIESGKIALPRLESAIYDLKLLHTIALDSPEFVLICNQCAENLNGMVQGIVYSIKKVSRKVFAEELRAYFDPIYVQGRELFVRTVEMPLFIFDDLLWATECTEETYLTFKQSLLPYISPPLRKLYAEFENQPSLLAKVGWELKKYQEVKQSVLDSVNTLIKLFQILIKFRKPHIKVAKEAYIAENNTREKGSGGYNLELLSYITDLSSDAMIQLNQDIKQYLSKSKSS